MKSKFLKINNGRIELKKDIKKIKNKDKLRIKKEFENLAKEILSQKK